MWTATKLQDLQKKLAKQCADLQKPPPLSQLGKMWVEILKPTQSGTTASINLSGKRQPVLVWGSHDSFWQALWTPTLPCPSCARTS